MKRKLSVADASGTGASAALRRERVSCRGNPGVTLTPVSNSRAPARFDALYSSLARQAPNCFSWSWILRPYSRGRFVEAGLVGVRTSAGRASCPPTMADGVLLSLETTPGDSRKLARRMHRGWRRRREECCRDSFPQGRRTIPSGTPSAEPLALAAVPAVHLPDFPVAVLPAMA